MLVNDVSVCVFGDKGGGGWRGVVCVMNSVIINLLWYKLFLDVYVYM